MKKTTPRIAARPDPAAWADDELMTLGEAVALFWPDGFFTERKLRNAVKNGRLPISQVNGRYFVTRNALRSLSVCTPVVSSTPCAVEDSVTGGFRSDLERVRGLRRRRTT
jgi:hypothetical protein